MLAEDDLYMILIQYLCIIAQASQQGVQLALIDIINEMAMPVSTPSLTVLSSLSIII